MASPRFRLLALLPLTVLLAGCAARGPFPSLAPRAVERLGDGKPAVIPPAIPSEPGLAARVAELAAEARRGQVAFEAAFPAAAASVGRAGATASESWVVAQQAISRLEAARGPTLIALAQLDRLGVERASRPTSPADFQALLAALDSVAAMARAQTARIDRLRNALSPI